MIKQRSKLNELSKNSTAAKKYQSNPK